VGAFFTPPESSELALRAVLEPNAEIENIALLEIDPRIALGLIVRIDTPIGAQLGTVG
jgi:hypothetical protein